MDGVTTLEVPEFDLHPPSHPSLPLAEERRAFDRLLPELLTTHRGQYVAVLGDRVVGSGPDLFDVLSHAYGEHGYRPILCRLVTDQPRAVVHIPFVRRAAHR